MLEDYFRSDEFLLFLDETLREKACMAVDEFLENNSPIDNNQLHSISSVIQAGSRKTLEDLVVNQKEKNTKEKNKKFWEFVYRLIFMDDGPEFSLRSVISNLKEIRKRFEPETGNMEKKERAGVRKKNKDLVNQVIDFVLPFYFEHFTCHYYYKSKKISEGAGA